MPKNLEQQRILGIDPGAKHTGFALITAKKAKENIRKLINLDTVLHLVIKTILLPK